ncbi:unnamed protein product [Psylliodes chrysocephalus]|uniref:Odorant receptor n=1 Tax=Psylliodes chrysocephalus TaxID=3402493 RepID=A0A9P0CK89_9CUCU|nr:unnamed protein product [Psylliodes chrysocephala]
MYPKFESSSDLILYLIRVSFFMGLIFGGFMVSEIVNLFQSINDLGKFIDALFSTFTNLVALVKLISIAWNQDKLVILSEKIDRMEFRPKSENQEKILRSHVKISKFLSLSMYCGCVSTCLFWIMFSLTDEDGRLLLVPAYFPFMNESTGVFIFCYIFEIVALWVSGFSDLSADCFIASWIMVVSAQLKLLNDTLANLHDFAEDELKKYQNPLKLDKKSTVFRKIMNKKLIECIIHYQYILEFAKEVNDLFSISIFGQLIVSIFVICATLFEITSGMFESRIKILSMCLFFICLMTEIFPVCYFSNEVVAESDKLTTSAYQSDWLDCSAEYKQNLLFFMTRTQKVVKMYAGNFVELSLDIFINKINRLKPIIESVIFLGRENIPFRGHRDRGSLVVSEGSSEDENSLVNNEGCIMVVSAELRLLNDTLANLHNFAEDEFKKYQKSLELDKRSTEFKKMMNKKLIECIIHYQYILEFAEEVNDLFSISIFGQLNVSLFAICATLFEITSSDKLTTSAYQSDWLDCSAEYKQNLLFFMTRTQKVLILYAGNFVEISLNIFVTILKSSYSFCTVLNQFGE